MNVFETLLLVGAMVIAFPPATLLFLRYLEWIEGLLG